MLLFIIPVVLALMARKQGILSLTFVSVCPELDSGTFFILRVAMKGGLVTSVCDAFFVRPPKPKYLRGRSGHEIVRLLSTSIPKNKILSAQSSSLPEVSALTKEKLKGRNLYVVFYARLEAKIDIPQLLKEAEIDSGFDYKSFFKEKKIFC